MQLGLIETVTDLDWATIATVVAAVVTGAVGVLRVIAPLTKNETDNWLLRKLQVVEGWLVKLVVPPKFRG